MRCKGTFHGFFWAFSFLGLGWVHAVTPCPDTDYQGYSVVSVEPGDDIVSKISSAPSKSVVLIENGVYKVPATIYLQKPDVIVRSKSGNREDVVLEGHRSGPTHVADNSINTILHARADKLVIAHLTLRYARHHLIHATPSSGSHMIGLILRDLHLYDGSQQLIKVNETGENTSVRFVDEGILECSLIEFKDNRIMQQSGSNFYTGGLDVHGGNNWIVRKNTFRGIENSGRLMEHAVHFWRKSRGTIVENNLLLNNYRGIGFGMSTTSSEKKERKYADGKGNGPYFDHVEGIIRNNVIYNEAGIKLESGIELANVIDVQVYHNTILSVDKPYNSIEYRWPNTKVVIKNNIVSHNILRRDNATAVLASNQPNAELSWFQDPAKGDFHLVNGVDLNVAEELPEELFGFDMDGGGLSNPAYIGAYQGNGSASTVSDRADSDARSIRPNGIFETLRTKMRDMVGRALNH